MTIHRPKLKFREELKPRSETKFIVIHHVARKGRRTVQTIHQWHLDREPDPEPMAGIGYHYYIDRDGEIFQGRPRDTWGAHVKHHNSNTIGVCFDGDFRYETISDKQLEASVLLLSVLSLGYGDAQLCTHHYLNREKQCPGSNFPIKKLIEMVKAQKDRFKALYGDPKTVDYSFLLKLLD